MVESIGESLWLAVGQRIMILVVAMLRTARLTAVDATIVVTVAIASLATWTAFAVATLAARTALTLLIAFWFRNEHAVREFILARLGVYLHELHLNLVTLVDAGFLILIIQHATAKSTRFYYFKINYLPCQYILQNDG